jgi:SAM-dependent methyltransferase
MSDSRDRSSTDLLYHCQETGKLLLGWLLVNGQTARWATEKVVIREILSAKDFQPFLQGLKNGASADIGCGGGRYLIDFLAPRSAAAVGVEYNQSHIDLARKRIARAGLSHRIKINQGSAEELPLEDSSIDLVLCTQVLEHLPSPAKGVAEISRILRPQGRAILSIPIPPDPLPNPEHLHKDFLPLGLDEMIGRANLRILRRDYCMYAITRAIARLAGTIRVPLPLNPLIRLEQATSGFIPWPNPHTYICVVEKA